MQFWMRGEEGGIDFTVMDGGSRRVIVSLQAT